MRIGNLIRLVAIQLLFFSIFISNDQVLPSAVAENPGKTHLYFITNDGCAPCRQVEPGIEALKREGYPVTTVKLDGNWQWARRHGVDRTPTVVMITGDKIVGRHAGLIDAVTLKKWFAVQGIKSGSAFANVGQNSRPGGTKVVLGDSNASHGRAGFTGQPATTFNSPTMLKGTRRAGNAQEQLALQATVLLKVEDPEGSSYATGTVIHSFRGECLVVTCGHVFRDARGTGTITAEYGFENGHSKKAVGELIFYDSDARDIGLVAIRTADKIVPVPIANRETSIARGRNIFSIGCDHGQAPTIRRSKIKNKAAYDGAMKYDIYGRPVDGRSGGGLFTESGELIGICNAAAVEVDEGIYTALDTVYWQLAKVKLDYLFDDQQIAATPHAPLQEVPVAGSSNQTFASAPAPQRGFAEFGQHNPSHSQLAAISPRRTGRTDVAWGNANQVIDDKEIIILIRSKSNPSQTETITIPDPTSMLLDYLGTMNSGRQRQLDVVRLRTQNETQRR